MTMIKDGIMYEDVEFHGIFVNLTSSALNEKLDEWVSNHQGSNIIEVTMAITEADENGMKTLWKVITGVPSNK